MQIVDIPYAAMILCAALMVLRPSFVKAKIVASALMILSLVVGFLTGSFRWQTAVGYVLVFVILLLSLRRKEPFAHKGVRVTLFAVVLILGFLPGLLFPLVKLPLPDGPYKIGSRTVELTDYSRKNLAETSGEEKHRKIKAQIWYPVDSDVRGDHMPYAEDGREIFPYIARMHGMPGFALDYLNQIKSHAIKDAPISSKKESYPVVIYLTGNGGSRFINTLQVQDLVSNGYIVIGVDQPGVSSAVSFSDGGIVSGFGADELHTFGQEVVRSNSDILPDKSEIGVPYLASDVTFLIDELGKMNDSEDFWSEGMDLGKIGVMGVSLGGIVASYSCSLDSRISSCAIIDAPPAYAPATIGLDQDILVLTKKREMMEAEGWDDEYIEQLFSNSNLLIKNSNSKVRQLAEIEGVYHLNFTDLPLFLPGSRVLNLVGPTPFLTGARAINLKLLDFYNESLGQFE